MTDWTDAQLDRLLAENQALRRRLDAAEPIDVERLGKALHAVYCHDNAAMHSARDHSAGRIVREYLALAEAAT